jgi:tRNA (cytidine/uridine-2'-O-)-methyltransferase
MFPIVHGNNVEDGSIQGYLESAGIPYDILANNLDTCYRLPTTDKIRSLNLSNCAAISLYEVLRQLDYEGMSMEEPEMYKGADFLNQFKD